ncbi:hypothetical protein ALC56_01285 [Trachymyrmex septentrionalis]|uniref:Uncharacterized protein n=1 Tax=Trachymyrmex septentrionalis TaxID=34720 RepID=A0A151K0P0_9HYME|nr:hypothetical protein ALC56_01285 [Trachymyrmex septentrionalis]
MGKCPPKFYDLKIYEKTHISRAKKARMHRRHETIQNLPLNVACRFLDFCNYGFARMLMLMLGCRYILTYRIQMLRQLKKYRLILSPFFY